MPFNLSYCDLPDEIDCWPALPLSLSGEEVMPLDYWAGHTGWLLYSKTLSKETIVRFQNKLGVPMVIVSAWRVGDYHVVRLAGLVTLRIRNIATELSLDIVQLGHLPHLGQPGLLVLDMDGTVIENETLNDVAAKVGLSDKIEKITEAAMQGDIEYATSLRQRVKLLKGTELSVLKAVRNKMRITSGMQSLVELVKQHGWHIAIISGGFNYFSDSLCEKLGLDEGIAHTLDMKNGVMTGKIVGEIIDAKQKAQHLTALAEKLNIPMSQTVAVGDGANDIKMLQTAAFGIAYQGKPKLAKKAQALIKFGDILGVYCILSGSLKHEMH